MIQFSPSRALNYPWSAKYLIFRDRTRINNTIERVGVGKGLAIPYFSQSAQLQLEHHGLVPVQGSAPVILIYRAVIDGKGSAFVLIAPTDPVGRDCERTRIGIADHVSRIILTAHIEGDVALCEVIVANLISRGECEPFA